MSDVVQNVARLFRELGEGLDLSWSKYGYDERTFSSCAENSLVQANLHNRLTLSDLIRWSLETHQMPVQSDLSAQFGQPPVTIYNGRDFRIELLFWVDGMPAIHEHSFSGAFAVLHGASLHTIWQYTPCESFSYRLSLGSLTNTVAEELHVGDVRSITAKKLIHSTFHLNTPSVSIVARTISEAN